MHQLFRSILTALSIACLAAAFGVLPLQPALAQGGPPPLKQVALTQAQIDNAVASAKEMDAITSKLPQNAPPSAKAIQQMDGVAKKHGFAGYGDYETVVGNIGLVMDGMDHQTKKFIGSEAALKQEMEQVKANTKMSAADKKQALANLDMALKAKAPEIANKGNIDLVIKNYDKIDAAFGEQPN